MMNVNMSIHKDRALRSALLFTLLAIFFPLAGWGVTKQNADDAYTKGNYQQAIADYKELLKRGTSASLYYNLGNAYFRSDSLTQAILAYERASLLSPGDDDIRFNLQFARSKTIDKITPQSEMFFVTWYRALVNLAGVDSWATLSGVFGAGVAVAFGISFCSLPWSSQGRVLWKHWLRGSLFVIEPLCLSTKADDRKPLRSHHRGPIGHRKEDSQRQ